MRDGHRRKTIVLKEWSQLIENVLDRWKAQKYLVLLLPQHVVEETSALHQKVVEIPEVLQIVEEVLVVRIPVLFLLTVVEGMEPEGVLVGIVVLCEQLIGIVPGLRTPEVVDLNSAVVEI